MTDLIALTSSLLMFILAVAYTHGADRLKGPRS
jgi:hypothetical protein